MPRDRIERGLVVMIGMLIMYFSTLLGLLAGFALTVLLLGRQAWREE